MGGEFNKQLCDERHDVIEKKMDTLFKKFDLLSVLITLLTIIGIVANLKM